MPTPTKTELDAAKELLKERRDALDTATKGLDNYQAPVEPQDYATTMIQVIDRHGNLVRKPDGLAALHLARIDRLARMDLTKIETNPDNRNFVEREQLMPGQQDLSSAIEKNRNELQRIKKHSKFHDQPLEHIPAYQAAVAANELLMRDAQTFYNESQIILNDRIAALSKLNDEIKALEKHIDSAEFKSTESDHRAAHVEAREALKDAKANYNTQIAGLETDINNFTETLVKIEGWEKGAIDYFSHYSATAELHQNLNKIKSKPVGNKSFYHTIRDELEDLFIDKDKETYRSKAGQYSIHATANGRRLSSGNLSKWFGSIGDDVANFLAAAKRHGFTEKAADGTFTLPVDLSDIKDVALKNIARQHLLKIGEKMGIKVTGDIHMEETKESRENPHGISRLMDPKKQIDAAANTAENYLKGFDDTLALLTHAYGNEVEAKAAYSDVVKATGQLPKSAPTPHKTS